MNKHAVLALLAALSLLPAAQAADMNKVLRVAMNAPETGFDPAKVSDLYSSTITENIYDPLVSYDYLARPARLVPNTISALPTVSADGKVYTFRIKPGIYFADDAAFKGKKRELTAADYAYSLKRHLDPGINSPWSYLLEGRFVGTDELVKAAGKGALNYDAPVEGIKVVDKYTLQLTLRDTNFNFLSILAMPAFGAVAREVIDANRDNTNAHPVGTGPYLLKEWKPGSKIVLEANPGFRKVVFDSKPGNDPVDKAVVRVLQGKTLPRIGRIEVAVIEEEQPLWLSFLNRQLDISGIPQAALQEALVIDPKDPLKVKLADKYARQGMQLQRMQMPEVTFHFFNMQDPVVGGDSKDKIALRRAIAMAFPVSETIATIRRGQAVPMNYIVPAGVAGHNPAFRGASKYDPAAANALLDRFGYRIGSDGYRSRPDGKPLAIELACGTSATDKQWNEYWQKAFDNLKIHLTFRQGKWNELAKANRQGKLQMWGMAWGADYPDGENFMQLLYGKNAGDSNSADFKNAEYDRLYEASLKLPDGAERNRLYDAMNKIAVVQQPWIFGDVRVRNTLAHPYVKGLKLHPLLNTTWRYLDLQK
ncbi:ABC transporter substrate-binding protein [Vogesella sp. LIG4]|uniref:ABC transporter substrate-binding protein n=1 Tax=Vogesella sp. LIG4 TaxID=1192162 RepID=UPI00081FEE97|nr:ABC transporter substrate-binding protein [Vogesella sp. LIG4]SCK06896.1 ABC-type oligopeptide transport system, substrate-binding protein [Vogesella sp. LIG4]